MLNPVEPPCTDPYARWCGRGGAARRPPIPIVDPNRSLAAKLNRTNFILLNSLRTDVWTHLVLGSARNGKAEQRCESAMAKEATVQLS